MKTRKCRTCKEDLPIERFATYVDKRVDKEYVKTDCKECHKHVCRRRHIQQRYGITLEEYDQLLEEQGHCCAICKGTDTKSAGRFVVDHNHSTGEVRGLLCQCCNAMLGQAQDSISILAAGITYLNTTSSYATNDDIIEGDYTEDD